MAPLEPELVETDYAGLVATVLARAPRRSLVVLLTALDPAPVEEGLLPVLPRCCAGTPVLLASVGDPRVAATGGRPRRRRGGVRRRGGRARRRRPPPGGRAARRRGVEVVDAPPDELPPALADRYLALKAAGRL